MKTTNKLLLGLLIASLLAILSLMVYAKVSFKDSFVELSGKNVTLEEQIEPFTHLEVSGLLGIYYTQGETTGFRMEGDSALVALVEIKQAGNKLDIKLDGKKVNKRVNIYLQNPELNDLKVVAGSRFVSENQLTSNNLDVEVVAGGNAEIDGIFEQLKVSTVAGGRSKLSGKADKATMEGTAGSILNAYDLESNYCDVNAVAGAKVEVLVIKELRANATAGGIIRYKGSPELKEVNASAGGRLTNKN